MTGLPDGWEVVEIKQIADVTTGNTPSTKETSFYGPGVPFAKPGDLKSRAISKTEHSLTELGAQQGRIIKNGAILVSCIGNLGKTGLATSNIAFNQQINAVTPRSGVRNRLLMRQFQSAAFQQKLHEAASATTIAIINKGAFEKLSVVLPPTNEQTKIEERIEALFDEIDKGVESLQTAKAMLGLYRQSLLKSAFEGRLTADWREQNADKLEDPETLLARIQSEREARYKAALDEWENAVAQWRADGENGKKPPKPKPPKIKTNQPLFEVISVSDLPKTWTATKLVQIIDVVSGATPKGIQECKGCDVPFFKVSDMNTPGNERVLTSAALSASNEEARSLRLSVCPAGTVVFPKRGGAILTNKKRQLGQASAFDLNTMGLMNSTATVQDEFLWFWMLGVRLPDIYDGSNVPQINSKNVDPLSFPICAAAEQVEIARILDVRLEAVEALESEIDSGFTRANALRQSILKKAFSGQLVPQNPSDEPASVILDRIKSERAEAPKKRKRKVRA